MHGIFIRAPAVIEVGPTVEVLSRINVSGREVVVAVRQEHILGVAFHVCTLEVKCSK
jgi:glutamine amidotransferase PdxT